LCVNWALFLARVGHFKTRVKRENNWLPTKITYFTLLKELECLLRLL
jgi:hypothetical protein